LAKAVQQRLRLSVYRATLDHDLTSDIVQDTRIMPDNCQIRLDRWYLVCYIEKYRVFGGYLRCPEVMVMAENCQKRNKCLAYCLRKVTVWIV
jgi:hypothetical protein